MSCAEDLRECRNVVAQLEQEAEMKRNQVKSTDNGDVLKGEDVSKEIELFTNSSIFFKYVIILL